MQPGASSSVGPKHEHRLQKPQGYLTEKESPPIRLKKVKSAAFRDFLLGLISHR